MQTDPERIAAGLTEAQRRDEFNCGYLVAVANIIHTHGEEVIAEDVLAELGETEGSIKRLGLCDFDGKPLRKLFREISRKRRLIEGRHRRKILENRHEG